MSDCERDPKCPGWTETAMPERRPHWTDDLIWAVADRVMGGLPVNGDVGEGSLYDIIAAVEDWVYDNFQGGEYDNPVEYTPEELAIQRARDECRFTLATTDYDTVTNAVTNILRALDGAE